jgi:hypothetical protein
MNPGDSIQTVKAKIEEKEYLLIDKVHSILQLIIYRFL